MTVADLYAGREQTLVKHSILRKYLERFALIVCSKNSPWESLTYVDCFSGPWNAKSEKFEDSSFAIALDELRKARETLASMGKYIRIRCFFLEKDPSAYAKLKEFAEKATGAEVAVENASFEDSIPKILDFVKKDGRKTFPFFFIDPTGWTGFAMETISPILSYRPCEVLINFMGHIHRFLDSPQGGTQESFKELFGSLDFKSRIQGMTGLDKQDAVVEAYGQSVCATGGFTSIGTAVILHPEQDKTHFHLIYATRHPKGVEVFKDAEKKAMEIQVEARAGVERRRAEEKTGGQQNIFGTEAPRDTRHSDFLKERYTGKSKSLVVEALQTKGTMPYDEAWALALSQPITQESDLKDWIAEWKNSGMLEVEGMKPRQRVPKRGERNSLIWNGNKK